MLFQSADNQNCRFVSNFKKVINDLSRKINANLYILSILKESNKIVFILVLCACVFAHVCACVTDNLGSITSMCLRTAFTRADSKSKKRQASHQ